MLPMRDIIETNKHFFNGEVLNSLKYLSENFNIPVDDQVGVNYNWQVFANYFLCVDAIKEGDESGAENYLRSALENLSTPSSQHDDIVTPRPTVIVITPDNIDDKMAATLKGIYDKPDNDVNDDGVYAFGPFSGDTKQEFERIEKAFVTMALISPSYYDFVTSLVKQIVLVGQTERGGIKSGSTLKTLGCIIISPNTKEEFSPVGQYIEDLVHEASHTRLFLEQTKDQLVNNPVVNLYAAPFRKDKRPMSGIYHANYVLGNIVSYFSQAVKSQPNDKEIHNDLFLARALQRYNETYALVEQYGDLTVRGRQIFNEMKVQVDKCLN